MGVSNPSMVLMDRAALWKAADEGDVKSLQELVAVKPDVIYSTTRNEKNTALHIAASKGHTSFVHHFLLYMGTDGELTVRQNIHGDTPMHLAARRGHLEVVEHLIQYLAWARGTNADFQWPTIMANEEGNTPLHDALFHRKLDIALKLLEADPRCAHALNAEMLSPLYIAAREGLVHVVKKIADQGLSMASVSIIRTPLHQAVLDDNIRALEILLNNIVELVELADSSGNNALNYAAWHDRPDMVSMLHNKNSTLAYKKNTEHYTPLHMVAKYGSIKAARELLKQCPDTIEIVDFDGRNAFHIAIINNKVEVLKLLLKDELPEEILNKQDRDGNTPLHYAVLHRKSDMALKLLEANPRCSHMLNAAMQSPLYIAVREGLTYVVKKIADQGLHVASMSTHGTALHQSVLADNIRALEILLNRYEELMELTNLSGNNALHYAAQHNNARMVSILLNKNSTLAYKKNNEKHTPLHMAACYGSSEAAKGLLKRFPDAIEMVDNMGRNALHIAVINDVANVLKLLLKYVLPEEMVNEQDWDGNTPLHHAASLYRIQPALLLLNDPRVNPSLFNKDGHTAFALSDRKRILEMSNDEINLWKELKKHESRRYKQQRVITQQSRPQLLRRTNTNPGTTIIVATLMSIATFAATLTMPGGYSRQSGTAIVGHHQAFKIFVVCNTMSMCASTVLVLCFIWRSQMDPVKEKLIMLIWGDRLMLLSALGMIMSMLTAVYLATAPASRWVAYVTIAIGASTPFFGYLILKSIVPTNWRVDTGLPLLKSLFG